ncbi:hypothetical protein PG993_004597 [Apiospora rasikravindrae]|uniref:Uncharacterized protein n=1 Tax=Apiospora rasikravindrae TaxID=990691 RepID=A0ABR1TDA6_9PEZI
MAKSERRFIAGARDAVKSWRKLNRFYQANSAKIIEKWKFLDMPRRRGTLRRHWPRNTDAEATGNGKGKETGKGKQKGADMFPTRKHPHLEGLAPWRPKDGKEPTAKAMVKPSDSEMPKDLKGWTQNKTWLHDRDKLMFPYFNEKDLESEGLLEIIRARAADPPSEFSAWDWYSWNKELKVACGLIPGNEREATTIQDWHDLVNRETGSYGEEFNIQQEAAEWMGSPMHPLVVQAAITLQEGHIAVGHVPDVESKLAMEVQGVVYQFLLGICEELASDEAPKGKGKGKGKEKDKEPAQAEDEGEDEDEEMPDADAARAMGEAVRALGTPWRDEKPDPGDRRYQRKVLDFLQTCRPGLPFTSPNDINWDFIEQVVHDRLVSAENELLGMRENPAVFAEKMKECREHHWRQVAPITKARPGMSEDEKNQIGFYFGNTRGMAAAQRNQHQFLKKQFNLRWKANEKTFELQTAIVQRIATYEIWSTCFHVASGTMILRPREGSQVSADYQKLACMIWAHRAPGFTDAVPANTIADEMAEIVERGKNGFSDLNKGFIADFRASNDVQMELGKFLLRHTDGWFKAPYSFMDRPHLDRIFRRFFTPIRNLFALKFVNINFPCEDKWKTEAPPWQALVERAEKAEAPDYRQRANYNAATRLANQEAETNLRRFWTELDRMLEKAGAIPLETRALFERARPLRTPDAGARPGKTSTTTSSSSKNTQDATVVTFSAGTDAADRPSRLVLEDRREKEKTRGVPDPSREPVRAAPNAAPPPAQRIPVTKRAMDLLELILGEYTENQPVAWDDFVAMMKSIGFDERTTNTGGSLRLFVPLPKLTQGWGIAQTASKHRPHPEDHHYLRTVRDWARNEKYGLAKYKWTLDTFVLEKKAN